MTDGGYRRCSTTCLLIVLATCVSCRAPSFDGIAICTLPASDRIVARVSVGCASDHRGATLSCEVERDGSHLVVTASGHDGRDPDDSCANDLVATCESEPLADGEYTVSFDDETHDVLIPNTDDSSCEPEGV